MNEQKQIRTGDLITIPTLAASQLGYPDSAGHLTEILRSFNYTDILIALARINLFLQARGDISNRERILRKNFCSRWLRDGIERSGLSGHIIFNRESTLRLLSEAARVADPCSTRSPDTTLEARNDLARCYLVANELMIAESPDFGTNLIEELPVELIPAREYATNPSPSPHIKKSLVRSNQFFVRLQNTSSTFVVDDTFFQATGLPLKDYQYLIFGILTVPLKYSPDEILDGSVLFVETKPNPRIASLYDKLLQHSCVSIDELSRASETISSLPNEFRLWRKYPLMKLSENRIMCIDIGFLKDKLDTGVFWIIRDQREKVKKGKGKEVISIWGEVFEDYAASIIERGINAQLGYCRETCLISPKYDQKRAEECADIIVYSRDTLILLECKAPVLAADTKFSIDAPKFRKGIKLNVIKGIEQLWSAIQYLAHTNKKHRRKVKGIDVSKVKKIFPVLVLSDDIFSIPFMNRFLNAEFRRFVKHNALKKHLEIMPLTVLTIDDLEDLEPYLRDTPLHSHLDEWITQVFNTDKAYPFSHYMNSLGYKRENIFIEQEFIRIRTDMMEFFSAHGLK